MHNGRGVDEKIAMFNFFIFMKLLCHCHLKCLSDKPQQPTGYPLVFYFLQVCSHKYFSLLYNSIRIQHSKHNSMRTLLIHSKITDRGTKQAVDKEGLICKGMGQPMMFQTRKLFIVASYSAPSFVSPSCQMD
jgi:hypothetical protein